MKILLALITVLTLSLFSTFALADTVEERLKILEDTLKKQQQTIEEQQKLIEELKVEIRQAQPSATAGAAVKQAETPGEVKHQVEELNEKVNEVVESQKKALPSEFNPSIGLVGETIFSYNGRGSSQTGSNRPGGFDAFQRSVELNAAASVDPFAKAYVVANATADARSGESTWEIEEAAIQTTSLPCNLELKAGRFFGEFGRLAYIHDHELPFVNRPLVLDRYIGGESRTDGAQVNWLLPVKHYISLTVGVGNQFGADSPNPNDVGNFRNLGGWNYWGRLSSYFDITPDISLEPGISGLWNPNTLDRGGAILQPDANTLTERERRLAGADMVLSWRPLRSNQFQSLTWGTELLYSNNRYDVNNSVNPVFSQNIDSVGIYTYLTYKWHRQWSAGFLYDFVQNAQNNKDKTWAYSPYITWALSHWNQLRLQYTYTDHNAVSRLRSDNAIYLQWAWIIGSHAHGWQQR